MATYARILILAAAYFASGYAGLKFPYFESTVTLIWPPTGIALAALLCWGLRVWPGAAIGAFAVNLTTGVPLETVALITIGNTLSGVVGAALLTRFSRGPALDDFKSVALFLVLAVAASPLVSSLGGAASICLTLLPDWHGYGGIWWGWWVGDLMGVLLFAPPLLLLAGRPWRARPAGWFIELALITLGSVAVSILVHTAEPLARQEFLFIFVSLPFALWGVVRFGLLGAAIVNVTVCLTAIAFLTSGHSFFITGDAQEGLLHFYGFFVLVGCVCLLLAGLAETALLRDGGAPDLQQADRIRRVRTVLAIGCGAFGLAISIIAATVAASQIDGSAWQPLGILMVGATLSGALSLYLLSLTRTEERITRLVMERSALLQQARLDAEAAMEEAQRASRAKSEFLAHMSHELRSPLNAILGYAELALNDPESRGLSEQGRTFIRTIIESGNHLVGVIGDILDLSKIESGNLRLERVPFDLRRMAVDVVSIMTPAAEKNGNSMIFDVPADVHCIVVGDPVRIRQVVLNYLSNAAKFTRDGTIHFRIARLSETPRDIRLRISVEDTGVGIAEHKQAALFEAFTQADMSTTRQYGGTGLGLAINKQLVAAMGGEIGLQSELGRGSTFWFDLTFEKAEASALEEGPDRAILPVPPMTLLLVEDVELNRHLAERMLENAGHRVVSVDSGMAALEAIGRQAFDAVLMDVQMPGLDGVETTERIRQLPDPAVRDVPIVALTANVANRDIARYRAAGMDHWCAKPISMAVLSRILKDLSDRATPVGSDVEPLGRARG